MNFREIIKPNLNKLDLKGNGVKETKDYITNGYWLIRKDLLTEVEKAMIKEKASEVGELSEKSIENLLENAKRGERNYLIEDTIWLDGSTPVLKAKTQPEKYKFNAYYVAFVMNKLERAGIYDYELRTNETVWELPVLYFVDRKGNLLGAIAGRK